MNGAAPRSFSTFRRECCVCDICVASVLRSEMLRQILDDSLKFLGRTVGTAIDHQVHNVAPVLLGTFHRYRLLHSMALATELEHGALSDVFGKGILRC